MPEKEAGRINGKHNAAHQGQHENSVHLLTAVSPLGESFLHRRREHHARVSRNNHQSRKVAEQIKPCMFPVRVLQFPFHFFQGKNLFHMKSLLSPLLCHLFDGGQQLVVEAPPLPAIFQLAVDGAVL